MNTVSGYDGVVSSHLGLIRSFFNVNDFVFDILVASKILFRSRNKRSRDSGEDVSEFNVETSQMIENIFRCTSRASSKL